MLKVCASTCNSPNQPLLLSVPTSLQQARRINAWSHKRVANVTLAGLEPAPFGSDDHRLIHRAARPYAWPATATPFYITCFVLSVLTASVVMMTVTAPGGVGRAVVVTLSVANSRGSDPRTMGACCK